MSSFDAFKSSKQEPSHIEGPSTAFGTSLNYCAIRILGMGVDHPVAVKARGCLHRLGLFVIYTTFRSGSLLIFPRTRLGFGCTRLG
jgi:hypothetical protein